MEVDCGPKRFNCVCLTSICSYDMGSSFCCSINNIKNASLVSVSEWYKIVCGSVRLPG